MAIYSTGDGMKPQAQTDDDAWNRQAEAIFKQWAARAEITRRFSFEECQHLVCRGLDVDGEYFVMKVRDRNDWPRLQLIEAHRIGDPSLPFESQDGVIVDAYGAPIAYRLRLDDESTRNVPANAMMHIYEPENASALRSAPTLQHSILNVQDSIELLALEKHAVKANSDAANVITRDAEGLSGDDLASRLSGAADDDPTDPASLQRIIGGKTISLRPGEKFEAFESKRPSPTFMGFYDALLRDSSAGMLPYEFVSDPSKVGGAATRLVVAKADRRFSYRQMILIKRFLVPVWGYVIGNAIDRGLLAPKKGWNLVSWVTPRRVTVDAGREAQQNRADVETGLKTLSDHYAELGMDFREELERRAADAAAIVEAAERYGVPVSMLWKPSGTQVVAEQNDNSIG